MSNEKWNDMWRIMKSGRFEFVDKVKNEILCIICKKILINAHYGPCGCRYCLECITKYLNEEQKICPGNTNDCKDELMNINTNVFIDQATNRKLSKIIVKCSQKDCDFKDELRNIEDHIKICESRSFECPYGIMGCNECNFVNTDLKTHMLMEIVSHTKLLFEFINKLKNEIKTLREDKFEVEKNNKDMQKYIEDFQLKIVKDYEEIKVKLKEIEGKYAEEQNSINDSKLKCENENKEIKEKLEQIENQLTEEQKKWENCKLKWESNHKEIKENLIQMENNLNQKENANPLKTDMKKMNNEIESITNDLFENKIESAQKIDEINKIITNFKFISKENEKSILSMKKEMRVFQKNQEQGNCGGEFVWRINKWREKMERAQGNIEICIHSEPFYSHRNGYKMRLSVWPNGHSFVSRGTHFSIECCAMQGEYDDILSWPFKLGVTFELINQYTGQIHTSSTLRYEDHYEINKNGYYDIYYDKDNRKPKDVDDSNLICWHNKFTSLKELSNENDQIFIRCRVNIDIR